MYSNRVMFTARRFGKDACVEEFSGSEYITDEENILLVAAEIVINDGLGPVSLDWYDKPHVMHINPASYRADGKLPWYYVVKKEDEE